MKFLKLNTFTYAMWWRPGPHLPLLPLHYICVCLLDYCFYVMIAGLSFQINLMLFAIIILHAVVLVPLLSFWYRLDGEGSLSWRSKRRTFWPVWPRCHTRCIRFAIEFGKNSKIEHPWFNFYMKCVILSSNYNKNIFRNLMVIESCK